jgi:hypothetical protein
MIKYVIMGKNAKRGEAIFLAIREQLTNSRNPVDPSSLRMFEVEEGFASFLRV